MSPRRAASTGRTFLQGAVRTSRLLWHWRAADLSLTPLTGQVPSFTRATRGGYVQSRNGAMRDVGHTEPRFTMLDLDGNGTFDTPALVLEGQMSNLCGFSEDYTNWTTAGTGAALTANALFCGDIALSLLASTDTSDTFWLRAITFTGADAQKRSVSVFIKKGPSPPSNFSRVIIQDTTAGFASRLWGNVSWNADGSPSVAMVAGTLVRTLNCGNGIYRLEFQTTAITVANAHRVVCSPGSSTIGNVYMGGVQVTDSQRNSTYIKTTGAGTATKNAETLTWPVAFIKPTAFTLYLRSLRIKDRLSDTDFPEWLSLLTDQANGKARIFFGSQNEGFMHTDESGNIKDTGRFALPEATVMEETGSVDPVNGLLHYLGDTVVGSTGGPVNVITMQGGANPRVSMGTIANGLLAGGTLYAFEAKLALGVYTPAQMRGLR